MGPTMRPATRTTTTCYTRLQQHATQDDIYNTMLHKTTTTTTCYKTLLQLQHDANYTATTTTTQDATRPCDNYNHTMLHKMLHDLLQLQQHNASYTAAQHAKAIQ